MIVGEDIAYPDKFLAIDPGNAGIELEGEKTIDPNLTQSILTAVNGQYDRITADGSPMVIVSSPVIRRFVSRLIRQQLGDVTVLAFNELPDSKKIEVVAVIGGENTEDTAQIEEY